MKRKIKYTKSLGKTVASLARPFDLYKYHVISGDSRWSVVLEGGVRALRTFSTVEEAVIFAKDKASENIGEVVIHEESGLIKNRISFVSQK